MTKNNITTTVVIPCYNDGIYIQEAIDSVFGQSLATIEIIVVDDASTDPETLDILSHIESENILVLRNKENAGPSAARNRAIAIAKGNYILPLDADDKIASTYIKQAEKILDDNPDIGIVYCEAELFGRASGKWDLPTYAFPDILLGNMIFATALFRKSDWEKAGGYNENMREGNEDFDFWLSLIELDKQVYRIPETLFYYRIKSSSRTITLKKDHDTEINTFLQIFKQHEQLYIDNIKVFFEKLKMQQTQLTERDFEIIEIHEQLKHKDEEIIEIHEQLKHKDEEIIELHKQLKLRDDNLQKQLYFKDKEINEVHQRLHAIGEELAFARSYIEFRDQQVRSMLLRNRAKRLLKKVSPFHKSELEVLEEPQRNVDIAKEYKYEYKICDFTDTVCHEIENFQLQPLISIVMPVYNVEVKWLEKAIRSIESQWYTNWELCIADDKSTNEVLISYLKTIDHPKIKVDFLEKNLNISAATNAAIEMASGSYIALMDNDDEITPDALYEIVKAINVHDADLLYSDEDFITIEGEYVNPHFKPDWSPDLLLSHNYITHFTCFRRSLIEQVGYFDSRFDGAQDYELFLRMTEKAERIHHIPRVLYHWRMIEGSTSGNSEAKPEALGAGRRALEEAMKRRGIEAKVEDANLSHYFRIRYAIKNEPLVSIVIPFKDKPELLDMSIGSILGKSSYMNYEIIGISNNSEDPKTFRLMKEYEKRDARVKFYEYNVEFNYADINNHAVNSYAKGEHILLLNNDIEVISEGWIEAMLEHSQRKEVGCVGAKLYFPNETIQHAGIIIGLGGYAGHSHKTFPRDHPGYFNRLMVVQNVSAVTAACLMIKKEIYQEVGGMDEEKFKVAYNDVDFCLRVLEKGYRNIFTPYAEMYHHESISRGYETTPEKIARFQTEKDALFDRHFKILINGDPHYNPNLTHDHEDFSLCSR